VSLAAPIHHKTVMAKESLARAWFVADVEGKTLGRAATKIAAVLRGKTKATFTTYVDAGDFVVVINADKIRLSARSGRTSCTATTRCFRVACAR